MFHGIVDATDFREVVFARCHERGYLQFFNFSIFTDYELPNIRTNEPRKDRNFLRMFFSFSRVSHHVKRASCLLLLEKLFFGTHSVRLLQALFAIDRRVRRLENGEKSCSFSLFLLVVLLTRQRVRYERARASKFVVRVAS